MAFQAPALKRLSTQMNASSGLTDLYVGVRDPLVAQPVQRKTGVLLFVARRRRPFEKSLRFFLTWLYVRLRPLLFAPAAWLLVCLFRRRVSEHQLQTVTAATTTNCDCDYNYKLRLRL